MTPPVLDLAPDRAPPPPGWWPPAPGWWWLAGLVIVVIAAVAAGAWWWRRRHADPARRLRRAALQELDRLEHAALDATTLARGLEHLARRYAIGRFGRDAVARLSGDAWLEFAVAHGAADWSGESGRDLLRAAYGGRTRSDPASARARWLAGARALLRGKVARPGR